ncbi:hypothetical protein ACFRQM_36135 [Streptomyces sp. NPDC056831]
MVNAVTEIRPAARSIFSTLMALTMPSVQSTTHAPSLFRIAQQL